MRRQGFGAALAGAALLVGPAAAWAATGDQLEIRTLGNRADLISGGDALVQVVRHGVAASDVRVQLNGHDATRQFAVRPDGRYLGLLTTLRIGGNVVSASAPGASTVQLPVTNHAIGGPVFSGAQIQPWLCTTDSAGLGPPTDSKCDAPTKYEFFYKSTDPSKSGFQPYDPQNPPSDVADTVTDQGRTVPYIVRRERGTANRGIYDIAVLFDPKKPWSAWAPQAGWNHKLYYEFGASCGTIHSQSEPDDVLDDLALSRGFMVVNSSMNVLGNNCSTLTSAESAVMLKEHVVERYGDIRYTMANGCSGGSIGQHVVANEFPGLLDGIQPACTYADNWTTGLEVDDCHLLVNYFNNVSPQLWAADRQRAAVDGHRDSTDCVAWDVTFSAVSDPRNGCGLPADQMYDPATNPTGCRGTLQDFMVSMIGRRPPSMWTAPERIAGGFAKASFDNTGVQYGLKALQSGLITPDQFLDLNSKIGGVDVDFNFIPRRSVADPGTDVLYTSGQINDGRQLGRVADIELQDWSETAEIHTSFHAWSMRARLDRSNGNHDNQVIWTYPASGPIVGVAPTSAIAQQSFLLLDRWLSRVEADKRKVSREQKVAEDKPDDAVDACFIADHEVTDMSICRQAYPYYGDARLVAGAPFTDDVGRCQLKPLDRGAYSVAFTDDQWAQLKAAFPSGVCDYTKPGVGQAPSQPWTTFAGGPGGKPMGPAPVSQAVP